MSRDYVWKYIQTHIPYNPLHDQGYRSIIVAGLALTKPETVTRNRGPLDRFHKVECGIHTFLLQEVDFHQI